MMTEQAPLVALLCEALALLHHALKALPWVVTTNTAVGADILDTCGRLQRLLHAVAAVDMPLANSLGDIQAALGAIAEELQGGTAPDGGAEEEGSDDTQQVAARKRAAHRAAHTKLARWQMLVSTLLGFGQRRN